MNTDHVHFYAEDAKALRDWFVDRLGFQTIAFQVSAHTHTEVVSSGAVYLMLSSPLSEASPVAQYLNLHPPGVADLAFQVSNLEAVMEQAIAHGAKLLHPLQVEHQAQGMLKWAQIQGWGDVKHTLIERKGITSLLPQSATWWGDALCAADSGETRRETKPLTSLHPVYPDQVFTVIDHMVLNVAAGDLAQAVDWYERALGFERQQTFRIETQRSGLSSQVLIHPQGTVQFPINQPVSSSSQIQEFLDVNRGPGVQHIALQTNDIVAAIAQFRQRGLLFLQVPTTYYSQLQERSGFCLSRAELEAIACQEVLADWHEDSPEALLLQAFTRPIFDEPTFFFELIERQTYQTEQRYEQAKGFGEANFRALFEAIEREQIKRGSLRG